VGQFLPIRGVIFDMDGVLSDSEPLINAAAVAMFQEQGLAVQPEDFVPFVGMGEDRYIGGVAEKYRFHLDLAAAKRRTYEIYLDLVPRRLEAFPGAVELVQACRRAGLRTAVASSADRIKILANLEKIGLPAAGWDALVAGEDVEAKKPAPDIFVVVAAKLGLTPDQCVVVEDAANGVQAAKAARMRCVAVTQTFPAERLLAADLLRERISDVSLGDLVGAQAPPMPDPPPLFISPLPPVLAAQPLAASPGTWGFWATFGLGTAAIGAAVAAQAVVAVVWVITLVAGHRKVVASELETNGLFLSLATCAGAPMMIGLSWLFAAIRRGKRPADYLGWRLPRAREMVWWTTVLLVLVAASDGLTAMLGRPIVPEFMTRAYQTAGFLPLLWLALVIIAPLAEETLFRGFLFEGVRQSRLGAVGAITITSGLWALTHLQYDAYGIAMIFILGLFLGYVRLQTHSICATIFLHSLMNMIATLEAAVMTQPSPVAG
jgi:beta-phosphoglucomutase